MKNFKDSGRQEGWMIKADASNVIDLSYPMDPAMTLLRPIYGKLTFECMETDGKVTSPEVDATGYPPAGFYSRAIRTHSGGILEGYGTHVEASSHPFGTRGRNIDEYPLRSFIGPGVVIDISDKSTAKNVHHLSVEDVSEWENKHGRIPEGAIVIVNTGRKKYWGNYEGFFGLDEKGEFHYPGIDPEACELFAERKVSAVGTDGPDVDGRPRRTVQDYPSDRRPHGLARETLMKPGRDILNIEYLANVDNLPEAGALIICPPIRFVGGAAGMVRALAILPD